MSTTQNIGLTDITTVELGNSTIGEDINSRFENIHNNFNVLSTTDYLKGDKGNSVKIIEFPIGLSITDQYPTVYEQNDLETPLTPEKLYKDLVRIITSESESETQTPISELNGLGEDGYNKINLICEEVIENGIIKNILKGSLPFLYLDPNFSKGENLSTGKQNYSCLIIYGNNGFKKSTSIPKLYYDKNIEYGENSKGSFCWNINGYNTGIIAQGPQGKNGRDGNCYIVKLGVPIPIEIDNENFDTDTKFYEIKQVFVADKKDPWMDYEDFKENGNQLSIGSSCICIFETTEHHLCFGIVTEIGRNMESVIGVFTNLKTNIVNFGAFTLLDALSDINSNSEAGIRGLFVPYTTKSSDGSTQRGHMIWANSVSNDPDTPSDEEDHSLHIGPIKNVLNNDLEIDNETTRANELNVHYGNIKLYPSQIKINPVYLDLEASSEGKMLFVNTIQSKVLLQLDEISIYDTEKIYEFDIAYYGIDQYTEKQNLIISRKEPSSSNDQAYYRGRKTFNGIQYDMWQWDINGDHQEHDDDNIYVLTEVITMNRETNISADNDIILQSPSNLKLESQDSSVLLSQSNLRLGTQGSSVILNEKINILTDNDIIIDGSQGELKIVGDEVSLQGNSRVSITDDRGDSIQLNSGINISSNDNVIIQTNSGSVILGNPNTVESESNIRPIYLHFDEEYGGELKYAGSGINMYTYDGRDISLGNDYSSLDITRNSINLDNEYNIKLGDRTIVNDYFKNNETMSVTLPSISWDIKKPQQTTIKYDGSVGQSELWQNIQIRKQIKLSDTLKSGGKYIIQFESIGSTQLNNIISQYIGVVLSTTLTYEDIDDHYDQDSEDCVFYKELGKYGVVWYLLDFSLSIGKQGDDQLFDDIFSASSGNDFESNFWFQKEFTSRGDFDTLMFTFNIKPYINTDERVEEVWEIKDLKYGTTIRYENLSPTNATLNTYSQSNGKNICTVKLLEQAIGKSISLTKIDDSQGKIEIFVNNVGLTIKSDDIIIHNNAGESRSLMQLFNLIK